MLVSLLNDCRQLVLHQCTASTIPRLAHSCSVRGISANTFMNLIPK
jgi:hypothetical protein